ncbi:flagellar motor protein MotB [Nibricoccus aquaticus]|uniref:Flagellar motor protein MotB n=1 Tax=Nibricoccus aquaticus TaxID=2576891 RepID=A0A290Q9P0_9BACT|nr:OmpA family protein [Nibricoccus aquaticus]ATC65405.1 flagellar motor protein MotB [Nibricoccus aquaticus]
MNLFSKSLSLALLSAVVALTGCVKKPSRPDPNSTVLGQQGGGLGGGVGGDFGQGLLEPGTDLTARTDGLLVDGDLLRGSEPVFFDLDRAGIKESERAKIQKAKAHLDANPTHRVLFEGHCDWRGTAEYNLGLGDRRAASAKKYLETLGIPAARIEVISKGDIDAKENASDADMANDRRADIIFITK